MIEIKVSYDRDRAYARRAVHWWAALALTPEEKEGVEDPLEMERLADADARPRPHPLHRLATTPPRCVERIRPYVELGFNHLVFHAPGDDQVRFLDHFSADVLPRLQKEFAGAVA